MSSIRSSSSKQVTTKPWFLTFNSAEGDVFAWKDGARLKLKNGQSAGRVKTVCVLSAEDGTVTVSENVSCLVMSLLYLQYSPPGTSTALFVK